MGTVARVAVMGSRYIEDKEAVGQILSKVILALLDPSDPNDRYSEAVLVLGGARGVDTLAREWADEVDNTYLLYKPPFMVDTQEKAPVPRHFSVRRQQMVDNCDVLVVISGGTGEDFDRWIKRAIAQGKTVILEEVRDV